MAGSEMKLLPYSDLGAKEISENIVHFGILLPDISEREYVMWVRIIHEDDQFIQDIPTVDFEMKKNFTHADYWAADVEIKAEDTPHPDSRWGMPGKYIYRMRIRSRDDQVDIDFIGDPFAREFGTGKLSAFTLGYVRHEWSEEEKNWKTPALQELIMYELILNEFGGGIEGTIKKLDYLQDLGINCIEIMPVSNVSEVVDWGYLPLGYFGIDERFGNRKDFQRLVDEAHKRGIAVILDVVYGHTGYDFTYSKLYRQLGKPSPLNGSFAKDYFSGGADSTDFLKQFTRDFFYTVNYQLLDIFHVDGFRYDCVPNYFQGNMGVGYANLVYNTYQLVKQNREDYWQRFFQNGEIHLIQCAEQLEDPKGILYDTYSNCTWQNTTLGAAKEVIHSKNALVRLGLEGFGLEGLPAETNYNNDRIKKTALQYIENHDHSRFICNFATTSYGEGDQLFQEGDRNLWYKLQPYLIGMFTAKGIPLLWQGQEFCENYFLPEQGMGRVRILRAVRWDYFYDYYGRYIISLIRKLSKLRRKHPQFKVGEYYFYNHFDDYLAKNILLFHRKHQNRCSMVALNFGDQEQTVPIQFPLQGNYTELLHGNETLENVEPGQEYWLKIPSNYGRIWDKKI